MNPKIFRKRLIAAWWSSTCSLLALSVDRAMTVGLAEELVDCVEEHGRTLTLFRADAEVNRFGSRWLVRNDHEN